MRLWTIHPQYLDTKGLVALWREALLAQAVLNGQTRGYTHHPQLTRFRESASPKEAIALYLRTVQEEASRRGYRFDAAKIGPFGAVEPIETTQGQLEYEWARLKGKLHVRAPDVLEAFGGIALPDAHPLFRIVPGPVAPWEILKAGEKAESRPPLAPSP